MNIARHAPDEFGRVLVKERNKDTYKVHPCSSAYWRVHETIRKKVRLRPDISALIDVCTVRVCEN